jgi:hypothetical protein
MQKYRFSRVAILTFFALCLMAAGCGKGSPASGPSTGPGKQEGLLKTLTTNAGPDICKLFDGDFVYSATGKPIVKVEPSIIASLPSCSYYTEYSETYFKDKASGKAYPGGRDLFITLEKTIPPERQKKNTLALGMALETDSRIRFDHAIAKRKDGSIWSIFLFLDDKQFLDISMLQKPLASDDALIDFAAKVADRVAGRGGLDIKFNPAPQAQQNPPANQQTGQDQQSMAQSFLDNIGSGKIDAALAMMDANQDTKQAWGVNFNGLKSLKVTKIEPTFKEEWTATRETFKAQLEVTLKSGDEFMGWSNGKNFRWITLQKTGDKWLVHELANNP